MSTRFVWLLLLLALAPIAQAQNRQSKLIKSHLGIGVRAGIGRLMFSGARQPAVGPTEGIDIEYLFLATEHLGIKGGIGLSNTSSRLDIGHIDSRLTLSGQPATAATSLSERYMTTFIELPIMGMLQGHSINFTMDKFYNYYIAAGVRLAFPAIGDVNTSYGSTTIAADGAALTYDMADRETTLTEAGVPLFALMAFEAGVTVSYHAAGELVFALFCDFALNRANTHGDHGVIYGDADHPSANSYLCSDNIMWFKAFKIGLKAQYNFKW